MSATSTPTSKLAVWSLVSSLIGLVYVVACVASGPFSFVLALVGFLGLGSVAGVILGHFALNRVKSTGANGRVLALVGIILGYLGVACWAYIIVWPLVFLIPIYAAGGIS